MDTRVKTFTYRTAREAKAAAHKWANVHGGRVVVSAACHPLDALQVYFVRSPDHGVPVFCGGGFSPKN